jgi:hypothetical protein
MKSILLQFVILVSLVYTGCTQGRTYLTEQDKVWNPYREGDVLIFRSKDGQIDTIVITRIEANRFPEGLGAQTNERLKVLAQLDRQSTSKSPLTVSLLYLSAKTSQHSSKVDFEFSVGGGVFWGTPFAIMELDEYGEEYLELPYKTFSDVIRVDDNSNQIYRPYDIATIFWSKSAGYVKCEKKDGTIWELLDIIESK